MSDVPVFSDASSNPKNSTRGMRLPVQNLPESWSRYCREKRPDLTPADVWEDFRDYWKAAPGAKGLKADWDATWRTWVRKCNPGIRAVPSAANAAHKPFEAKPDAFMPPTAESRALASQVIRQARAMRVTGPGNDAWVQALIRKRDAGVALLPCQLQAVAEAEGRGFRNTLPVTETEDQREARLEREAIQDESENFKEYF